MFRFKLNELIKAVCFIPIAVALLGISAAQSEGKAKNLSELEREFRALPVETRYLFGPLFWLHGDESRERLELELEKVLEGGNGCFTAESRPHNDWLGQGWFRDLGICLDFARRHNVKMWIFDERWWPSGEVGGRVPQKYASKVLRGDAVSVQGPSRVELSGFNEQLVAVIAGIDTGDGIDGESLIDLTEEVRDGKLVWDAPRGNWSVMKFFWTYAEKRRGNYLVDGASKDAVEWYIETVYQPHYERFKEDFGDTIQGFFYDEPETWGDWGTEVIPMLKSRGVDWKKALVAWKFELAGEEQVAARYEYQDAKAEAWGRTLYGGISEWCHNHGVKSIGHFLEHNQLYLSQKLCAGNMFQLMKYSDFGGIDVVGKQLPPGRRWLGTYQIAKLASSISHSYGKKDDIAMVEIFGARGQDLTYPEMKWTADQMQVRGVNFFIPHSFNPRAPYDTDCPPYFYNGGYEPRWPLYRVFADYVTRLSLMLTGGHHIAPVALLFVGNSAHAGKFVTPEQMTTVLQDALFDVDWIPYEVFERDTRLSGDEIKLFGESYKVLIVPPVEVIPYETMAKAKEFFDQGGVVVGYGFLPSKSGTLGRSGKDISALTEAVWGYNPRPGLKALKRSANGGRSYFLPLKPTVEQIQKVLSQDAGIHPTLEVVEGETNHWLHILHRVKAGRDVFFITNQNISGGARSFRFRITAQGEPESWDAMRNEITAVKHTRLSNDLVELSLTLEPYESVLLVFNSQARELPMRLDPDTKPELEIPVEIDPSVKESRMPALKPPKIFSLSNPRPMLTVSPVKANPFNGKVYLPEEIDLEKTRVYLVCEDISPEAAARITLNGMYAGGFIEKPLRLEVSGFLRPGMNTIRIEPFAPKSVKLAVFQK